MRFPKLGIFALTCTSCIAHIYAKGPVDVSIASFALNLEYLEAQAYWMAAYGTMFDVASLGTGGTVAVGARKAKLSASVQAFAEDLATTELNHMHALQSYLGPAAIAAPRIDLNMTTFSVLASAALGRPVTYDPFLDDISFLMMVYIFEDVGVTAYNGALPHVTDPALLTLVSGLLSTESYQAGAVRGLLLQHVHNDIPLMLKGTKTSVGTMTSAIAALRSMLAGTTSDTGIITNVTLHGITEHVADVDASGLAFARSPEQVLSILYGTGNSSQPGLFFPHGIAL